MKLISKAATAVAVAAGAVTATAIPAAAYETVSIETSWGDGRGTIWRDSGDSVGYRLYLTDAEPDGYCVYWQVQGYRDNQPDSDWTRLTDDVCGYGDVEYDAGTKDIRGFFALAYDGYRVKICKNINNAPDSCSEASRIATRSLSSAG